MKDQFTGARGFPFAAAALPRGELGNCSRDRHPDASGGGWIILPDIADDGGEVLNGGPGPTDLQPFSMMLSIIAITSS